MIRFGKHISRALCAAAVMTAAASSCINNDIPYPRIPQNILSIVAVGESKEALIDSASLNVTVYLGETTDIRAVSFSEFGITPGATSDPDLAEGTYDLRKPLNVTLSRYQNYQWTVMAEQTIERYFAVEGEIGESAIDPVGRRVVVTLPENTDLSKVRLLRIKLGPEGITTMSPALEPGVINLSRPLQVDVTAHGITDQWTIYAQLSELVVSTASVDAWSQVVWAYGNGPADVRNGFRYREASSEEWIDVPDELVNQTQGAFQCHIPHLRPLTEYVVQAVSGKNLGNEVHVTTQATADIPNGDFENWCQIGKTIFPYAEDGDKWWDTGNTGSSTLGRNVTVSSTDTPTGSGLSAQCNTEFVGIAGIGKLAAGSIYSGVFRKVDGTNGILGFGRPWTLRPTKLRGYFKYRTKDIDYAATELAQLKGRPDTCVIYVALADWTEPFEVRTNPRNRNLFDPHAPSVIAYGEMQFSGVMDEWQEFEIPIKYRSTSRIPSYIQITCSTSKYGDYFTGAAGAVLWVDQFSFSYDLP